MSKRKRPRRPSSPRHIDDILRDWRHDPYSPNVRLLEGADGRQVIQMRVDMGVLQLETSGRPDGEYPNGEPTWLEYLENLAEDEGDDFELSEDHCAEIDREFVQFYHRRICWLALHEFQKAVQDADHTLRLMDFCRRHSEDEQWTLSHEQYRPFVLFHRTQAAALAELEQARPQGVQEELTPPGASMLVIDSESGGERAESAIHEINAGLQRMRDLFEEFDAEEHFEEDELVSQLIDLREKLRDRFQVGRTLQEQLTDAIQAEEYEQAAVIRDKIAKRQASRRSQAH